jgi:PleD family two-component response regulator
MTQVAAPPSVASSAVAAPDTIRVLLVDDQAIIGEAVRRMLASDPSIEYRY